MDKFGDARRRAQQLASFCERINERNFSEKQSVLADVYSRLGNAYLELGDYKKALDYHNRDLKIAEENQSTERRSRALDNLGRVYARNGQFPQAIQVWERKVPLATSPIEKAWLFHEIGQCQLGLGSNLFNDVTDLIGHVHTFQVIIKNRKITANDPLNKLS
jgi:tetratricopeptide repeat protein 25